MWRPGAIRVFISHISDHKAQVGELSAMLDYYGFSPFVAHDAIEPTQDWQNVIRDGLSTCHVLVAYLTPGFHASNWTDQEVGWAMGRSALIVPINAGAHPYGFLGNIQAATVPAYGWESASLVTRAIAIAVFKNQSEMAAKLKGEMVDIIVRAFEMSGSFDQARFHYALVEFVPREFWKDQHFDRLTKAAQENRQLQECLIKTGERLPDALRALIEHMHVQPGA
jgi:hypothetical protein